jgi:hypothetical protein
MRFVTLLLQHLASRLDRRGRRGLVFGSALALTFFARATVAAAQSGAYVDAAAGSVMLFCAAVAAAVAWSARHRAD